MPATARQFNITKKDIEDAQRRDGGGNAAAYALIEVPADYAATLVDVEDYDKRDKGKSQGWLFKFEILGAPFNEYISFSPEARWKLTQVVTALGGSLDDGVNNLDPNSLIGLEAGAHVDWRKNPDSLGENEANYRDIKYFFPIVAEEENVVVAAEEAPAIL